ncbi:MAG: FHA domain-containing protein [Chlamydiia bacterium]|nr:FHA domain-containing protein [Chlamydiia bacterium]
MAAKLVAEEGTLKGLVLSLEDSDQWIIGRDPDACQLIIEDPVASRRHLICRNTSEGIILENLSTTNPVQVNSESVNEPRLLSNGDLVKIGSGTFRFYSESEAQVINDMTEAPLQKEELPVSKSPEEEINGEEEENHEEEPFVNEEEVEITANEEPDEEADNTEDANDIEVKEASIERAGGEEEEPQDEAIAEQMPEEEAANEKPEEEAADEEPEEEAVDEEEPRSDSIFDEEIDENEQILANINFDLLETGRWLLKVISGPNNGAEFAMQPGSTYMIGTDPNSCDIIFHDTSVSRQHARITVEGEDKLFIEDLKSKNGTLIDSNPLEGRQPLQPNTVVTLGTTSFVVFDREGEMQTIISPILPSIVKALQDRESEDKQRKRDAGNEKKLPQSPLLSLKRSSCPRKKTNRK